MREILVDLNRITNSEYTAKERLIAGENFATELIINLNNDLKGYAYYLTFQLNEDVSVKTSENLIAINDIIRYSIVNSLIAAQGILRVELTAFELLPSNNKRIIKSCMIKIPVVGSLGSNATAVPEPFVPWFTNAVAEADRATKKATEAATSAEAAQANKIIVVQKSDAITNALNKLQPGAVPVINDTTTGGEAVALSAEQGKLLAATDLEQKIKWDQFYSARKNSVKRYGAVGNGVADDTVAIQKALDSNSQVVYFPSGNYLISAQLTIKSSQTIQGDGESSIITLSKNIKVNTDMIKAVGVQDLTIRDLTVDGNKNNLVDKTLWTTCLQLHKCDNLNISNCKVLNSTIEGIYVYKSSNVTVTHCDCRENGYFEKDASGIHIDSCSYFNLSDCICIHNGFHGIILTGCTNSNISNIITTSNGKDGVRIQWSSSYINIHNVHSTKNSGRGLYFTTGSNSCSVSNGYFGDNAFSGLVFYDSKSSFFVNIRSINNQFGVETVQATDSNRGVNIDLSGNKNGEKSLVAGSTFDIL